MSEFLTAIFRANPSYEVVPFHRLPGVEQEFLTQYNGSEAPPAAVLRPRDGGPLPLKVVCENTAAVLQALQNPSLLPKPVVEALGDELLLEIRRLVLDGILEIDTSRGFLSGPEAQYLLGGSLSTSTLSKVPSTAIAALRYGEALCLRDRSELSARLYCYGRLPLTYRWNARLRTPGDVTEFLGLDFNAEVRAHLQRCWIRVPPFDDHDPWMAWHRRGAKGLQPRQPIYKLYISPMPEALPDTLRNLIPRLDDSRNFHFKVASTAIGLLRPDKLVLYYQTIDALRASADQIADWLKGCPAHGVPFTGSLDRNDLLSWGVDPSPKSTANFGHDESWRLWITNRLAAALISAQSSSQPPADACCYALERIELDGVDIESWIPRRGWLGEPDKEPIQ